jgi:hypothetical protein
MPKYEFRVNGRVVSVDSWDPGQPLLYILRNSLGLHAAKFGCGLAQCGACTVLLEGKPVRSCVTPVQQAAGRAVTTLDGLGTPEKPSAVQAALRLLHERHDHGDDGAVARDTAPFSGASQAGTRGELMPLRHTHPDSCRGHARGKGVRRRPWRHMLTFMEIKLAASRGAISCGAAVR